MSEAKPSYAARHVQNVEHDINRMKARAEQLGDELRDVEDQLTQARVLLQFLKKGMSPNGVAKLNAPTSSLSTASFEVSAAGTPVRLPVQQTASQPERQPTPKKKVVSFEDYKTGVDLMEGEFSKHDLAVVVGSSPNATYMALKKMLKTGYVFERKDAVPRKGKVPPASLWRKRHR